MSRQFRMERIVSERDGQNIFQGSAINPKTGCNSAFFLSSDENFEDEESDGSGGLVEPAEGSTPYALQARPMSRKSARFPKESHNDVKVQSWINNKIENDIEVKTNFKEGSSKPLKQKRKKDGNAKNKKGSRGKKLKSKKETIISDEEKIIEGTRNLMSQVEKKFKFLENEKNSRYKRLLHELNIFVSQHEKELVGRGNSINLEPVNVNMSEFQDWLDNIEKGKFNKNEVSEKYKINDDMFSDIFDKPRKTINRKSSKKIVKIKKSGNSDRSGENKKEVSLEILNEEVLNSWRSPSTGLQEEDDFDDTVIRVRPFDKEDRNYLSK